MDLYFRWLQPIYHYHFESKHSTGLFKIKNVQLNLVNWWQATDEVRSATMLEF